MLPFKPQEYARRLSIVQSDLQSKSLAGLFLFDPENMYWLTGYQSIGHFTFQTMFIPVVGKPALISRKVNGGLARATETLAGFVAIEDTAHHIDVLADFMSATFSAGDAIGLETASGGLTVRDYLELGARTNHSFAEWQDTVIAAERIRKKTPQIEFMRSAARCAEAGLDAALKTIAPGKTENDLAAAMHHASIAAGGEYLGHPPLVVAGDRTALCFAMWRRNKIREGDAILLESAGCIERYHAMVSRSAVCGTASKHQKDVAQVIINVLEAVIEAIRPGATSAEVDNAGRSVTEKAGMDQYFGHRAAYAIGIGFPPNWSEGKYLAIRPGDPTVLEPGMTFHVVPTLFTEEFGMCFSDSVLVTDDGCELLTDYPRKLFEIEA